MLKVELQGIRKCFGSKVIIPDLDLSIQSGEFLALVGPSGCGKSTLLRMIAGLEDADSGEIRMDGRRVNELGGKDRQVAMVFQNYALYPQMTVRDNLGFALRMARVERRERERRIEEIAEILGLAQLLDRKPAQLSGGQKQRVAMGRAMIRRPRVLLFDEPLSNLDAQLRIRMRAEIALLHRKVRSTVIYVTHDQGEAMTLADRIAVLNQGRVEQVGAPLDIYHEPATTFVASFIGTPPMNFLPSSFLPESVTGAGTRVGFRPESVRLLPAGEAGSALLAIGPGRVQLLEPLGSVSYVHLRIGDQLVVAELRGGRGPSPGSEVTVAVDPSALFHFDANGQRTGAPVTAGRELSP